MIPTKNQKEIEIMQEGAQILARIMESLKEMARPRLKTKDLNEVAQNLIFKYGAEPSFKGYKGFPAALCTSINQEIVHVVPSKRKLKSGDLLSLDLGLYYKGFHSDMALTVPIGKIGPKAQRLIEVTQEALERGIKEVKPDNTIGDVGNAIQKYVKSQGFEVIRDLCGHGIGKELHQPPQILNYGKKHCGPSIKKGMVLCLEPMVSAGNYRIKKSPDGFGFQTLDHSLSCHFEHEVLVTPNGNQVLTSLKGQD